VSVHRFFAPALDPGDETADLPRDEAEHLTRVLRLGVGDTVAVFNGRGHEFLARVVSAARREARVQLLSRVEPTPESTTPLTLVQAVLKGDKMDDVVRDAVMLGVAAIQPIVTRRSEVTVAALLRGARVERWRRVALASAKQSRRAVLPEILTPLTFDTWLDEPAPDLRLMFVEPGIDGVEPLTALRAEREPSSAALAVGPEGGWDPAELAAARAHGLRLVSLGGRTLRADAVPIAALSVLQFLWDHSC
jgi:16S rRNA (uracil1498-N3)-methyltransferase